MPAALSPERIERAGLSAWPGISVEWDGAWVRRAANGYTKRANSFQCFDPEDEHDAEARIGAAARWMETQGVRPVARITPLTGPDVLEALERLGWQAIETSCVYAMDLAMDLTVRDPAPGGRLHDLTDPRFLTAQKALTGIDDETVEKLQALLGAMEVPRIGIVLEDGGEPVATGLMAIADGIAIVGNVATDPALRRRGHGRAMMETALAWAYAQGARQAALNVVAGNAPARALYDSLGYRYQYDYHYRVRP